MRHLRVLGVSVSGAVVYLVMAACSAGSGASGANGSDSGFVDALVDALANPTMDAKAGAPDANAGPTGPTVNTVACATGSTIDGGGTYLYVEKSYPGKTVADLSAVRVVLNYPSSVAYLRPPGYDSQVTLPWIKDGSVAVLCGPQGSQYVADSVTFISP
jgi:hypothetical protein